MSEKLQNDASYLGIIEEFDDGLCCYGFYDVNGHLLLRTFGEIRTVKKNPKYRSEKTLTIKNT
jgi:hypothetical protein